MCEQVSIYGACLLSAGPDAHKKYAHAYNRHVDQCLNTGAFRYRFSRAANIGFVDTRVPAHPLAAGSRLTLNT